MRLMHSCLMHALPSAVGCGSVTIAVAAHVERGWLARELLRSNPPLALTSHDRRRFVVLVAESALIV